MPNLTVHHIKTFIGTRDFALARSFYEGLGCVVNYDDGSLAELLIGDSRFYLQNYYQKEWVENTMLFLSVADANAWFEHVTALLATGKFGAARVDKPKLEDYGALVTYVWDPGGVLLHFAEWQTPQ